MEEEILALMNKKDEEDIIGNIIYNLMVQTNQPLSEILKMPLPLAFKLLKIMKEENDKLEAESRRKR